MKILMLGWELPPHNSGGLGVACFHLSKALAQAGATIDFVIPYTASHPGLEYMQIHSATSLEPLDQYGLGAYDTVFMAAQDIRSVQAAYTHYVEQLVTTQDFDAIHAHDWLTMEAGMRAKQLTDLPLIVHVHATEYDRSGSFAGNLLIHDIEKQGLMMADRIVAVSDFTKKMLVDKYHVPPDKIEVIHNAIDVANFDDGYVYDKRTYRYLEALKSEGYTVISTVTRFTIQKGLEHLIRAAAKASEKYDKLAFLLAGDGEQRNELVSLAADLGIADKLFFTGFVRGRQWRDAYSLSDVFVMSSVSEPFGLTALEAAHHDNALIISRQSGVSEVLHSIFRYDAWDEEALADRMVAIATSKALETSLKENIAHEYAQLSWHDVAQACMTLYARINQGQSA